MELSVATRNIYEQERRPAKIVERRNVTTSEGCSINNHARQLYVVLALAIDAIEGWASKRANPASQLIEIMQSHASIGRRCGCNKRASVLCVTNPYLSIPH